MENLFLLGLLALAQAFPDSNPYSHLEPSELCAEKGHHLLPHESDCKLFYYCEYGMKWRTPTSCPEGTMFSYGIQTCDWPRNVECHADANRNFQAKKNIVNIADDSNNYIDNNYETTTEKKYNDKTYSGDESTEDIENHEIRDENADEGGANDTEENGEDYDGDENIEENTDVGVNVLPNGCPEDVSVRLLPHETDCKKYYMCSFGKRVQMECSEGTLFNAMISNCDRPENSGCKSKTGNDAVNSYDNSINNGEVSDEDKNERNGVDENATNSEDTKIYKKYNKQSKDITGVKTKFSKEDGKFKSHNNKENNDLDNIHNENDVTYNSNSTNDYENNIDNIKQSKKDFNNYVDSHENVGKNIKKDRDSVKKSKKVVVNDKDISKSGAKDMKNEKDSGKTVRGDMQDYEVSLTGYGDVDVLPNGCPANYAVRMLLPHESDCNKYYYCHNGAMIEVGCGEGYHFNDQTQGCVLPANSGCYSDGVNGSEYYAYNIVQS